MGFIIGIDWLKFYLTANLLLDLKAKVDAVKAYCQLLT